MLGPFELSLNTSICKREPLNSLPIAQTSRWAEFSSLMESRLEQEEELIYKGNSTRMIELHPFTDSVLLLFVHENFAHLEVWEIGSESSDSFHLIYVFSDKSTGPGLRKKFAQQLIPPTKLFGTQQKQCFSKSGFPRFWGADISPKKWFCEPSDGSGVVSRTPTIPPALNLCPENSFYTTFPSLYSA